MLIPKISIIVPIYNSEKYLIECLESIKKQNYCSYEVILIDDGSIDKSREICQKYVKENINFKLYSQKNTGVSSARNKGISLAKGEFIIFVDSDDYCNSNMLKDVSSILEENSLLAFGYIKKYRSKEIIVSSEDFEVYDKEKMYEIIFLDNEIGGNIANKVFSSKIIKENNLTFNENIHYCEDLLFVYEYIKKCYKLTYIKNTYYYYRMRMDSASFNFINKKNISILDAYSYFIDCFANNDKILYHMKYNYLMCYKKLKSIVGDYKIRKDIINNEKEIIKNSKISIYEKIKYYFIYENKTLLKIAQNIKKVLYKQYK